MYNELLEGLEISVLSLSEVLGNSEIFRVDSEYFGKVFLENEKKISSGKFEYLENLISLVTDGKHGGVSLKEDGVLFLRNTNVKEGIIDLSDTRYISHEESAETLRAELITGDILLTTIGSVGESVVIPQNFPKATINQNLVKIVPNDKVISEYISTFFNSKFGRSQIYRFAAGNILFLLNYPNIKKIKIPLFSDKFYLSIKDILRQREITQETSKTLYQEAENLLLSELGIDENIFKVSKNEVVANVKSFADFENSWRLDAEYYQPKYERLENSFKRFDQIAIKNLVNYPVASGTTPKSGDSTFYTGISDGVAFVRAVDIKENRVSINDVNYIRKEVHNGVLKRTKLYKGDVLFSIAGTVGRCGIFESDCEANINQACAILRFDENIVKRLYVILFFNSTIGQTIIEKYARQGVQTNLNLDELANMNIPILPMEFQERITQKIQESFSLKTQSEQLLSLAKRAVELAIEEGEDVAMEFILKR